MRLPRNPRVLIGIGIGLFLLLSVAAVCFLANRDWNRAKPWLAATAQRVTGRRVDIAGDLTLAWQRDPTLRGWRGWIPGPVVTAAQVTLGNPPWAKGDTFASAGEVRFDLDLLPLLAHRVSIPVISFTDPDVHLERASLQQNNWTFAAADTAPSLWSFDLGRVRFARGKLAVLDRVKQLDVKLTLEELQNPVAYRERVAKQQAQAQHEAIERVGARGAKTIEKDGDIPDAPRSEPQHYRFEWTAQGSMHGKPLKGSGAIGGMLALRRADQPFPLHGDVTVGDVRLAFFGTLTDPTDPDGLDMRLWISGASLAHLYDVVGIALPETRPFATQGHLVGRFGRNDKLRYEKFNARVGDSDLAGELVYERREPRPLLSGTIESTLLQFRDLAPLVGVNGTRGDDAAAQSGKVLPEEPFRPERWQAMDADVHFSGDRVFRDAELPIHKMQTRVAMNGGVLTLDPLKFRYAYGDVDAAIRMDGRTAPIKGTLKASAKGVQLKHVFKTANAAQLDLGNANATADLTATGNSVGDLLGAADGEVMALMGGGTISKGLIEKAALNVPNIVLTKLFGDRQVQINCAAADFHANNGSYEASLFVIDTDAAQIEVTGNVDLANEKLDLTVHPDTKGLRLLSLRAPIHVTGPFTHPQTGIDKGVLLARGAGAIGLAVVATPAAALLPLTHTNFGEQEDRCSPLLQSIQQAAVRKKAK